VDVAGVGDEAAVDDRVGGFDPAIPPAAVTACSCEPQKQSASESSLRE